MPEIQMTEFEKIDVLTNHKYKEDLIYTIVDMVESDLVAYCRRELNDVMRNIAVRIAVIQLNRLNTEGLQSTSFSGVSESYIDGLPADIKNQINNLRMVKVF